SFLVNQDSKQRPPPQSGHRRQNPRHSMRVTPSGRCWRLSGSTAPGWHGLPRRATGGLGYPRPVARGRTAKVLTQRWEGSTLERRPDELIVEEPLEIRLDDHLVATTMRTPGHDFELAAGLCHGD